MRSFKIKASDGYKLRVTPYVINKGQTGEYYGLKNADENQVLPYTPTWKTKKGAINWAKKQGYEVVESSTKKQFSVKASEASPDIELRSAEKKYNADFSNGPFACAEVDGRGHIYRDLSDSYTYRGIVLDEIADTFEAAKGAVDEWNRQVEDGITLSTKPKFNAKAVKASKSDKKKFSIKSSSVKSAYGYWDDEANGENYRKILHTLYENIFNEYDGKVVDGVELSVTDHWTTRTPSAYKFDITFLAPDYTKDTMLEVISDPKLRNKFLCRVSQEPFKYDEQFEIRQSGSKQTIINKINEIASRLSEGVTAACDGVKASVLKKRQQAVRAGWGYEESYDNNYVDETPAELKAQFDKDNELKDHLWDNWFYAFERLHPNDDYKSYAEYPDVDAEVGYTREGIEYHPNRIKAATKITKKSVKASHSAKRRKAIKAGRSKLISKDKWTVDTASRYSLHNSRTGDIENSNNKASLIRKCKNLTDPAWVEDNMLGGIIFNNKAQNQADFEAIDPPFNFPVESATNIKCNDGIAPDDYDSVDDMVSDGGFEYTGGTDDDMLEYVDAYLNDVEAWLNTDYVKYVSPDDWVVDASLGEEAVASDFIDLVASYLPHPNADLNIDLDDLNPNGVQGNDFFISFYPGNTQFSAPQIDLDPYYLTEDEYRVLSHFIPLYEKRRIGMYKAMQTGLGEYLSGMAQNIEASTDITAGIDIGKKHDYSNPIYNLSGYVRMLSDEVQKHIDDDIAVTVSDEAITFTKGGEVIYIQPTEEIIPEPDDLESDAEELATAVESVLYDKASREDFDSAWDATYDEDYATRAVEFSTDTDDDLEPITGTASAEDRIFDIITDKLRSSELAEFGDVDLLNGDADIKIHSNGADLDYIIAFVGDPTTLDFENRFMKYVKNPNYNDLNADSITNLATEIVVEDGTIKSVNFVNLDDNDLTNYDITAYEDFIRKMAEPTVSEIYTFIDEAVNDGSIQASIDPNLEPITGEDDFGFGFDSNGEAVSESMVDELERIAQEILDKSLLCKEIDQYASIKQFNYYASIPYVQESFFITFTYTADYYELSERDVLYEDGFYTTNAPYEFNFNVYCKNGEVEYAECLGLSPKDVKMFSVDRLELFAERLVAPVASEIYNSTTNI